MVPVFLVWHSTLKRENTGSFWWIKVGQKMEWITSVMEILRSRRSLAVILFDKTFFKLANWPSIIMSNKLVKQLMLYVPASIWEKTGIKWEGYLSHIGFRAIPGFFKTLHLLIWNNTEQSWIFTAGKHKSYFVELGVYPLKVECILYLQFLIGYCPSWGVSVHQVFLSIINSFCPSQLIGQNSLKP